MKTKMFAFILLLSGYTCCDVNGDGLLSRMLGRGGCGGASTCCDTGSSCGAGLHIGLDIHLQLPRLRRGGCGGAIGGGCDTGCDSGAGVVAAGCGCNAPAANACDSGCGGAPASGLLSGFSGFGLRNRGCGCRPGLLDGLRGRLAGGGCDSGCDSGCDNGGAVVGNGCGCNGGAPVASNGCGCNTPADPCNTGCGRRTRQVCFNVPNFGLLDRLRGLGNRGCGVSSCDSCGTPVVGNGCGCAGSTNAVISDTPAAQPAAPASVEPSANPQTRNFQTPTVDPNAFIIRGAKYGNN